eukprot:gene10021-11082_t
MNRLGGGVARALRNSALGSAGIVASGVVSGSAQNEAQQAPVEALHHVRENWTILSPSDQNDNSYDIAEEEALVTGDGTHPLCRYLGELEKSPPTPNEVGAIIDHISSNPGMIMPLLPNNFDRNGLTPLMQQVSRIVSDPNLIRNIKRSINNRESQIGADRISLPVHDLPPDSSGFWNDLSSKFPCTICLDVLAAPVVLECGHSFCGICIQEYYETCESKDIEVIHDCPNCCLPFSKSFRYELALDQVIQTSIEKAPACKESQEWKERRQKYLAFRQKRKDEVKTEQGDSDWWLQGAIGLLVVLVIALICGCRP